MADVKKRKTYTFASKSPLVNRKTVNPNGDYWEGKKRRYFLTTSWTGGKWK